MLLKGRYPTTLADGSLKNIVGSPLLQINHRTAEISRVAEAADIGVAGADGNQCFTDCPSIMLELGRTRLGIVNIGLAFSTRPG